MAGSGIWQPASSDESLCFAYSTSGTSSGSASLRCSAGSSQHCDLISFLAIAQKLQVTFSNLTWQPRLQILGIGGTAEIRQSAVNVQTSIAFKRVRQPPDTALHESFIFQNLIAEILVLMHPSILEHPNIITFEGICWDVSLEDERVWPVLLFEKSIYGDLNWFSNNGAGTNLSLNTRLSLCRDVIAAVTAMHSSGIIHGDIKPQNVLVFKDRRDKYAAKVVDFGYSTLYAGQDSLIDMPKSWPWSAPEHHHRGFEPTEAMKMDIFCLGLLCLWLVHKEQISYKSSTVLDDLGSSKTSASCEDVCESQQLLNIAILKAEGSLITFSNRATKLLDLSEKQKNQLLQFFDITLTNDPCKRSMDLQHLLSLLSVDEIRPLCKTEITQGATHDACIDFQIAPFLFQLFAIDFRVRRYVATCLVCRNSDATLKPSVQASSAFQLAICYHTGCGVLQSFETCRTLLDQSGRSHIELEETLDVLRNYGQVPTRNENVISYIGKGYLSGDATQQYREHQQVHNAIVENQKAIPALTNLFGDKHGVVLMMKSALASLYYHTDSLENARELETQCVEVLSNVLGREHTETLDHLQLLANIKSKQGHWEETEMIEVRILDVRKKIVGPDHMETISTMSNLASTYVDRGRYKEAEDLQLQVWTSRTRALGPEHPHTLNCLPKLALAIQKQGRLEDALAMQRDVVERFTRLLGIHHPQVLMQMSNLASIYSARGQWGEAEELDLQVLRKRQDILGKEHRDTLESMGNLAAVYQHQGRYKEAEDLNVQTLNVSHLGQEHPHTLLIMSNLAYVYLKLGRWSESEKIGIKVIAKKQRILGASHEQTLSSKHNLSITYQSQERWKEAERLQIEIIEATQMSQDHPLMMTFMTSLAITHRSLGRRQDSESIHSQVLERRKNLLGLEHPDTLNSMTNLAAHYYDQPGRETDAEEIYTQVLATEKKVLGPEHADLVISMQNLASTWRKQGRLHESEDLHRQQLALSHKLLGGEHPLTITSTAILAETLRVQSRYGEAQQLAREAVLSSERVHGKQSMHTLKIMDFQAAVYYQQGMVEECDRMTRAIEERDSRYFKDN